MNTKRGSDVFIKEDVRSILRALLATNERMASEMQTPDAQQYRRGFAVAIAAVATAFDIDLTARAENL